MQQVDNDVGVKALTRRDLCYPLDEMNGIMPIVQNLFKDRSIAAREHAADPCGGNNQP